MPQAVAVAYRISIPMRLKSLLVSFFAVLGISSCASMTPVRTDHFALADIRNIQGYNEPGAAFLQDGRIDVSVGEYNGAPAYVIGFYDSWLVLTGRPTKNRYWYKSDDTGVQLRLIRRLDYSHKLMTSGDILAGILDDAAKLGDVTAMVGNVSVEKQSDGYFFYIDVYSKEKISRNSPWLKSLEGTNQSLMGLRLGTVPGNSEIALIKGSISAVKVFTGW